MLFRLIVYMQRLEFGASARRNASWRYRLQMGPEQELTFGRQSRMPVDTPEVEEPIGHMEVFPVMSQIFFSILQEKQV